MLHNEDRTNSGKQSDKFQVREVLSIKLGNLLDPLNSAPLLQIKEEDIQYHVGL